MKKTAFAPILLLILMLTAGCAAATDKEAPDPSLKEEPTAAEEPAGPVSGGEEEIILNPESQWKLKGTLTLPDGAGPFPLAVLVHGMGIADRDYSSGALKPFRDLAEFLAEQGIATIRYDKRLKTYHYQMITDVDLTIYDEFVEDALAAAELARTLERIDPAGIFLICHSLGGYMIPKIAETDADNMIAGYIALAAPARPLQDMIMAMVETSTLLKTMTATQIADYKRPYLESYELLKTLSESDRGGQSALLGYYPTYWLSLAGYDPLVEAARLNKPLFFLQGGSDDLVAADFTMWQAALNRYEKAEFKFYPALTHLFIDTAKIDASDREYYEGRLEYEVAVDIADFIRRNR